MTNQADTISSPVEHDANDWPRGQMAHELVLSLSGWLSDEFIVNARQLNSDGLFAETARSAAYAILSKGLPTTEAAAFTVGTLLEHTAETDEELAEVDEIVNALLDNADNDFDEANTPFVYSAERTATDLAEKMDAAIDKMVTKVSKEKAAVALWRAERRPLIESAWPPPRDVYLLETRGDADLTQLTSTLSKLLVRGGIKVPLVEVREVGMMLSGLHVQVIEKGDLLWTREPREELSLVDVFDEVVDGVGVFTLDHPTIPIDEREPILTYLRSGSVVVETFDTMDDVIDSTAHAVVPTTIRTDGRWIWSDAMSYYLEQHAMAPQSDFLEHVRTASSPPGPVDSDVLLRATQLAYRDADAE